jgi:GWxTD domain-containing protein
MSTARSSSHVGRRRPRVGLAALVLLAVTPLSPGLAAPKGLDRAAERWLREVHLLILPEEEALFRSLPDPDDQKAFQQIFWARRDPDPATARNEMEDALVAGRARANELFTSSSEPGVETGCGQVYLLLGDPAEVQGVGQRELQGRGARQRFDSLQPMRDGARAPETWVYKSKPGDPVAYTGGELRIPLDDACRFSEGGRVLDDLRTVARSRVVRPALDYQKRDDGRLVPLAELSKAKDAPATTASATGFTVRIEPKLLLRTQTGVGYAAGLVRADLAGTTVTTVAGPRAVTVSAQAISATGVVAAKSQRSFSATAAADGSLVGSYGLALKPGLYTLRVAVALEGKSGATTAPLEVPDFEAPGLRIAPLILYPDEPVTPPDSKDPYAAMSVGALRLKPRFGDVFRAQDALQVVAVLSGARPDSAGKASLHARFSILKDGKPVARGDDQAFDTATAVASIGPVPLTGFAPGQYVVRIDVTDGVASSTATSEHPFELTE